MNTYFNNAELNTLWNRLVDVSTLLLSKTSPWSLSVKSGTTDTQHILIEYNEDSGDYILYANSGNWIIESSDSSEVYPISEGESIYVDDSFSEEYYTIYPDEDNFSQVEYELKYETTELKNPGVSGIHDALIRYTNLQHKNIPSNIGDYLKGIAVCARYKNNEVDNNNTSILSETTLKNSLLGIVNKLEKHLMYIDSTRELVLYDDDELMHDFSTTEDYTYKLTTYIYTEGSISQYGTFIIGDTVDVSAGGNIDIRQIIDGVKSNTIIFELNCFNKNNLNEWETPIVTTLISPSILYNLYIRCPQDIANNNVETINNISSNSSVSTGTDEYQTIDTITDINDFPFIPNCRGKISLNSSQEVYIQLNYNYGLFDASYPVVETTGNESNYVSFLNDLSNLVITEGNSSDIILNVYKYPYYKYRITYVDNNVVLKSWTSDNIPTEEKYITIKLYTDSNSNKEKALEYSISSNEQTNIISLDDIIELWGVSSDYQGTCSVMIVDENGNFSNQIRFTREGPVYDEELEYADYSVAPELKLSNNNEIKVTNFGNYYYNSTINVTVVDKSTRKIVYINREVQEGIGSIKLPSTYSLDDYDIYVNVSYVMATYYGYNYEFVTSDVLLKN